MTPGEVCAVRPRSQCLRWLPDSDWVLARARVAACAVVCGTSRGLLAACHACMQGQTQVTHIADQVGLSLAGIRGWPRFTHTHGGLTTLIYCCARGSRLGHGGTHTFRPGKCWKRAWAPFGCWGALHHWVAHVGVLGGDRNTCRSPNPPDC